MHISSISALSSFLLAYKQINKSGKSNDTEVTVSFSQTRPDLITGYQTRILKYNLISSLHNLLQDLPIQI